MEKINDKLAPRVLTAISIDGLTKDILENKEWLETSEGDEVECISLENLQGILSRQIGIAIRLTE